MASRDTKGTIFTKPIEFRLSAETKMSANYETLFWLVVSVTLSILKSRFFLMVTMGSRELFR